MLSKVFEWSRVANPTPSDDFVGKRTAVVQALADDLTKKVPLLIDCACASTAGIAPRFGQDSELVTTLIAAVRAQQPAFPENLKENALDLWVVCALVIGEIADRTANNSGAPSGSGQLTSAIVQAALASKPLPTQKYLREMLSDLTGICSVAMNSAADYRHRRFGLAQSIDSVAEAADVATFWKEAKPKFLQLAKRIADNEEINREELDTLWWAFNGVHHASDTDFSSMPVAIATLRAGADLADTVLTPPLPNTRFLLRRVLAADRRSADLAERPLRDLIGEWNKEAAADLIPENTKTLEFVRANPAVLPLSWLCLQLTETGGSVPADLIKTTGWDPVMMITPLSVAFQVFDERIAQRFHQDATE